MTASYDIWIEEGGGVKENARWRARYLDLGGGEVMTKLRELRGSGVRCTLAPPERRHDESFVFALGRVHAEIHEALDHIWLHLEARPGFVFSAAESEMCPGPRWYVDPATGSVHKYP